MIESSINAGKGNLKYPRRPVFVNIQPPETGLGFPALHRFAGNVLGIPERLFAIRQVCAEWVLDWRIPVSQIELVRVRFCRSLAPRPGLLPHQIRDDGEDRFRPCRLRQNRTACPFFQIRVVFRRPVQNMNGVP
jgi:hypothetical protein